MMPSPIRDKENVIGMDKLQERASSDAGAAEHPQTRTNWPQEPPIRANEEQVGRSEHEGSQRTSGMRGKISKSRNKKTSKEKRAA